MEAQDVRGVGETMTEKMFFVAIKEGGHGFASCIDEQEEEWGKEVVREFFRDCAGHEIRRVGADEMARLMTIDLAIGGRS